MLQHGVTNRGSPRRGLRLIPNRGQTWFYKFGSSWPINERPSRLRTFYSAGCSFGFFSAQLRHGRTTSLYGEYVVRFFLPGGVEGGRFLVHFFFFGDIIGRNAIQECGTLGEEARVAAIKGGIIHATRGVGDRCDFLAQAACRLVVCFGAVFLTVRPICVAVGTVWSFTCAVVRGRKVDFFGGQIGCRGEVDCEPASSPVVPLPVQS